MAYFMAGFFSGLFPLVVVLAVRFVKIAFRAGIRSEIDFAA